ncbi:MAG: hypothetical protein Q7V15_03960 [Phenylobacterium sp.]|uniref:hypothetical protein n=1 Tax=Phenylobacterium sp. TaxID=1871053 RepID=UPI002724DDE5|nr:hypothetical protein [Phenylobacterium sp.]MDO8900489.1 hypothetical protein [Phenylobacterium sp.]
MKTLLMAGAAGALVALAGCAERPESAALTGRLNCPESKGELVRVSAAADGQSCRYRTKDGADVDLRLVPVEGDPQAVLARLEAELSGLLSGAGPDSNHATAVTSGSLDSDVSALAAKTVAQAESDANGGSAGPSERVQVNIPGAKVDAGDESVSIRLPGLSIDANEADARVKIGPVNINASDDGATVRIYREVRLRGEALSRQRRGVRATYILASSRQPQGMSYVGLEAGGPKTGPLTVAIVSATEGSRHGDKHTGDMLDEIKALVRENGGV